MLLCRMLQPQIKPIWQEVLLAENDFFFSIKGKSYFASRGWQSRRSLTSVKLKKRSSKIQLTSLKKCCKQDAPFSGGSRPSQSQFNACLRLYLEHWSGAAHCTTGWNIYHIVDLSVWIQYRLSFTRTWADTAPAGQRWVVEEEGQLLNLLLTRTWWRHYLPFHRLHPSFPSFHPSFSPGGQVAQFQRTP